MAKQLKATEAEKTEYKLKKETSQLKNDVSYLKDRISTTTETVKQVVVRWDMVFYVVGAVISLALAVLTYVVCDNIYSADGKPEFVSVVLGAFLALVVFGLMNLLVWIVVNQLLIVKINKGG